MPVNTFFFWGSKIAWLFFSPDSFLVLIVISCLILLWAKAYQKARAMVFILSVTILIIAVFPLGDWLIYPLEKRFPTQTEFPSHIDGIIVLGGAENIFTSFVRQQVELNQASERFFAFIRLARKYPDAKHIYTGGTGDPLLQEYKGSDVAKKLFEEQGLDTSTLLFESLSRNTFENAVFTKKMINPGSGENWILITSASHMPRSLGIFHKTGWKVIPYSVDHYTNPEALFRITWNFSGNLTMLNTALKEWTGLLVYYLTGKTSQLFPGPVN